MPSKSLPRSPKPPWLFDPYMPDVGHRVVVFEGHSSAFVIGVRNTDVLLVDGGMLPFLQTDCVNVAFQVMRPNSRVFIHDRSDYQLHQVVKSLGAT